MLAPYWEQELATLPDGAWPSRIKLTS